MTKGHRVAVRRHEHARTRDDALAGKSHFWFFMCVFVCDSTFLPSETNFRFATFVPGVRILWRRFAIPRIPEKEGG